jgi:hypothetical protein
MPERFGEEMAGAKSSPENRESPRAVFCNKA